MLRMVTRGGKGPVVIIKLPGSSDRTILLPVQKDDANDIKEKTANDKNKKKMKKRQQKNNKEKDNEKDTDDTKLHGKQPKKVISTLIKSRQVPKLRLKDVYLVIAGIVKHREKSFEIIYHL